MPKPLAGGNGGGGAPWLLGKLGHHCLKLARLAPSDCCVWGVPLAKAPLRLHAQGSLVVQLALGPSSLPPAGGGAHLFADHTLPMGPPCPQSQPTSSWEMVSLAPAKGAATHDGGGLDSKPRSFCRRSTEGSY